MREKLKVGDNVEGRIIDFTHEGNGVMKLDDFIIFVSGGVIGDRVVAKIKEINKNFAKGLLVNIIQPSDDRVELDLNIRESRGGIPFIDYDYPKQLEWKRNKVKIDLSRIAGIDDVEVNDTIGMDDPFRYRNHVQIPVANKDGKTEMGFYELGSNNIVDMEATILQPELGNNIMNLVRSWMEKYKISPYDRRTKKGLVRHIGIRINKDNQIMVILVTTSESLPNESELIEMLKNENVISIYQNINKLNSSLTYGRQYKKLYGENKMTDYIGDYEFQLSPNSFFQVNRIQAEVLYNKTVEYLDLNKEDIVYDLYCGIGTISLYIANKAKKVYGVEIVKEAIEDARENAKLNNIDNVEFIVGKSEEVFPRHIKNNIKANKVVIDPPRKGCEKEVLESIVELNPERVVYVSCNPTTMSRDVKYLVDNGYKVKEVQPVDMFPHTSHVECIALIQRETM